MNLMNLMTQRQTQRQTQKQNELGGGLLSRPRSLSAPLIAVITLALSLGAFGALGPLDPLDPLGHEPPAHSALSTSSAHAEPAASSKPKSKRKGKRRGNFDRRRRAADALLKAGHPAIELSVRTEPKVTAQVYHGKELLGSTPLTLTWPKNTGALDLVVRAPGHIPVNTRLYTYKSDKLTVKLFKEGQSHMVFGFKKKVEEDALGEEEP